MPRRPYRGWVSSGNPQVDYTVLSGLFQQALNERRAGRNADAFITQKFNPKLRIKTMADLADTISYVASRGGAPDQPGEPGTPTPAASQLGSGMDVLSLGLGKQLRGASQAVEGMFNGDGAKAGYQQGVNQYQSGLEKMYSENPASAVAGGVGFGALGGLAMPGPALPGMLRGGVTAGGVAGTSAVLHSDLTNPDVQDIATQTGVGAGLGLGMGAMAARQRAVGSPAGFLANRAAEFGGENINKSLAETGPAGPPLLMETSKKLGQYARAFSRVNPDAGTEALTNVANELNRVTAAKEAITNHPETGYDAILKGKPVTDKDALAIWRSNRPGNEDPDARQLFDLMKDLRDDAKATFEARRMKTRKVTSSDLGEAKSQKAAAATLNGVLNQVPGFSDLQSAAAPYLDRETELAKQWKGLNKAARGSLGELPAKKLHEAILQELGLTSYDAQMRAARDMLPVLTSPATIKNASELPGLMQNFRSTPLPFRPTPVGNAPAAAGLLVGGPWGQQ